MASIIINTIKSALEGLDARTTFSGKSLMYSPTVLILIALASVLVATRLSSARKSASKQVTNDGARTVPALPYWIPLLGHLPNMGISPESLLHRARNLYGGGIFALTFGGKKHNIMYSPGLATALFNQKTSNADQITNSLIKSIFGFPAAEQEKYDQADPETMACYKHLLSEPSAGQLVGRTASELRARVKDLVGFVPSLVDQSIWERSSNVRVFTDAGGENVVEASLLPLTRNFIAQIANPALMGTNFMKNNPTIFEDLWVLDRGFILLATGLPRWLPIPALTRAHISRRRILTACSKFHEAADRWAKGEDPGQEWQDLDDMSALIKARISVYRKYDWSMGARAATEQALLWAMNANANPLVFWMLNRIYADKTLLAMLREEIHPYFTAVQPKQEFPIPEPPHLVNSDVDGLCTHCPLLKSCYFECLRLDTASWSLKVVKRDFVLQSREKGAQGWLLREGDYAHAAHDLHNTDPKHFDDPMAWRADRHVLYEGDGKRGSADMGSMRPYGGGASMCKGRAFAFKECMMFTAAIIALWEIEPAGGGPWKMPRHRKAAGTYATDDVTRVWITRRKLAQQHF